MQISAADIRRIFGFAGYPVADWPDAGLRLERDGIWATEPDWDMVDAGWFTPDEEDLLIRWFPDGKPASGDHARPVLVLPCELHDLIALLERADCASNCAMFDEVVDRWVYPLHELAEQEPQQAKPEASASESRETSEERRTRLTARKAELKKQGVRNFNQRIAEEEGISLQRVKQLLGCNEKTPKAAKSTPFDSITQPAKGNKY